MDNIFSRYVTIISEDNLYFMNSKNGIQLRWLINQIQGHL